MKRRAVTEVTSIALRIHFDLIHTNAALQREIAIRWNCAAVPALRARRIHWSRIRRFAGLARATHVIPTNIAPDRPLRALPIALSRIRQSAAQARMPFAIPRNFARERRGTHARQIPTLLTEHHAMMRYSAIWTKAAWTVFAKAERQRIAMTALAARMTRAMSRLIPVIILPTMTSATMVCGATETRSVTMTMIVRPGLRLTATTKSIARQIPAMSHYRISCPR